MRYTAHVFTAVYRQGREGWIIGFIAEVPGAHAQGRTVEEARMNLRDALKMMLEENRRESYDNFAGLPDVHREWMDEPP